MISRKVDSPRISILLGLGRAGLAVLAGAAFGYMAWNPLPPPPVDSATAEGDEDDVSILEVGRVEAASPDATMESYDRALVAPEAWALVTPRFGALDRLSRDIAGALHGDAAATRDLRPFATVRGPAAATGMQRSRGPPAGVISRGYRL